MELVFDCFAGESCFVLPVRTCVILNHLIKSCGMPGRLDTNIQIYIVYNALEQTICQTEYCAGTAVLVVFVWQQTLINMHLKHVH